MTPAAAAARKHSAVLALALAFVAGLTLAVVAQSARAETTQQPSGGTRVAVPLLEETHSGAANARWRGISSRVAVVPSSRSATALRARAESRSGRFALYAAPRPVRWARQGAEFTASGFVQGSKAAGTLCLVLREVSRGHVHQTKSSCRSASARWQRLSVTLQTKKRGSQVGVMVTGRAPGFLVVDELAFSTVRTTSGAGCRPKKSCAPPPAPPAPTTSTGTTTPPPTTTTPPSPTPTPPPPTPPVPAPGPAPLFLASGALSAFNHTNEPDGSTFRESDGAYRAVTGSGSSNIFARGVQPVELRGDGTTVWYGARIFLPSGFYATAAGWIDAPIRLINWKEYGSGNKDNAGISFRIWSGGDQRIELRTWRDTSTARTHVVGPRLSEEAWHTIEVHQRFSSTSPYSALYVDGQLVGEHTGPNWQWDRPFVLSDLQCGIVGAYNNPRPLTMLVDDCYLGSVRYFGL